LYMFLFANAGVPIYVWINKIHVLISFLIAFNDLLHPPADFSPRAALLRLKSSKAYR